jgi:hypothetical protein
MKKALVKMMVVMLVGVALPSCSSMYPDGVLPNKFEGGFYFDADDYPLGGK